MIATLRNVVQRSAILLSLVKSASLFKVSYIVGSYAAFFSGSSVVIPLTGAFGGLTTTTLVISMGLFIKFLTGSTQFFSYHFLAYHIPGIFASAYWTYHHWSLRMLVPFVCMLLFIVHPEGFYAAPYTIYWFIPMIVHCRTNNSIFAQSLASTLIAHAVGSVIWLYTVPMTITAWYALIPVVAFERIMYAMCMTGAYYVLAKLFSSTKTLIKGQITPAWTQQ